MSTQDEEETSTENAEAVPLSYLGTRRPGNPAHLGDGAYATFDGHYIRLRANSHLQNECTDEVAIDPGAIMPLIRYIKKYWQI